MSPLGDAARRRMHDAEVARRRATLDRITIVVAGALAEGRYVHEGVGRCEMSGEEMAGYVVMALHHKGLLVIDDGDRS